MNIFKFELKGYFKSILIWSGSIIFFLILYLAFFPAMASDPDAFNSMMEAFPDEVMSLFGINPDLPMMTIMGYYSLTMSFVLIPVAIQASFYGFNILSVEERELTADFLLTKPISRKTIFMSKFSAAFLALAVTNISIWISSFIGFASFKGNENPDMSKVVVLLSTIVLFQLFFLTVGMMISMMVKKIPSVISYSMGLGFGMFILSSLGKMLSSKFLDVLSPFNHFDPGYILVHGSYDIIPSLISVLIIITSFSLSYFLYLRRNIASL
jgi:ABC-2 type transport system permease protein